MTVSRNMLLEYFDKLSLDGMKCSMVKLDAMQLKECSKDRF